MSSRSNESEDWREKSGRRDYHSSSSRKRTSGSTAEESEAKRHKRIESTRHQQGESHNFHSHGADESERYRSDDSNRHSHKNASQSRRPRSRSRSNERSKNDRYNEGCRFNSRTYFASSRETYYVNQASRFGSRKPTEVSSSGRSKQNEKASPDQSTGDECPSNSYIQNVESKLKLSISGAGATKLVEEVEKRKLLFSKKEKPTETSSTVWNKTKFNQDSDGKMTAKFKRLMGIKDEGVSNDIGEGSTKTSTKREEYFANLEKQYEVARATTHTQRGLGLGFSSSSRIPLTKP